MEKAHPAVKEFIKSFRPYLTVRHNPRAENQAEQWWVCQPVNVLEPIDESMGLWRLSPEEYPVLAIPQASEIDRRVPATLYDNMWSRMRSTPEVVKDKIAQTEKRYDQQHEDWCRDVGWWHFRREMDQYNLTNLPRIEVGAKRKRMEDKLGRELK